MKKYESGRSMIEMLAVLAIIGVITVSALSGYSQAMTRYKTSRTVTDIVTIAEEVFKLYSYRRTYSTETISCQDLKDEGILDNNTCTNPFGGKYEVRGYSANNKCLEIKVGGLSKEVCEQIEAESWSGLTLCGDDDATSCSGGTFTIIVE